MDNNTDPQPHTPPPSSRVIPRTPGNRSLGVTVDCGRIGTLTVHGSKGAIVSIFPVDHKVTRIGGDVSCHVRLYDSDAPRFVCDLRFDVNTHKVHIDARHPSCMRNNVPVYRSAIKAPLEDGERISLPGHKFTWHYAAGVKLLTKQMLDMSQPGLRGFRLSIFPSSRVFPATPTEHRKRKHVKLPEFLAPAHSSKKLQKKIVSHVVESPSAAPSTPAPRSRRGYRAPDDSLDSMSGDTSVDSATSSVYDSDSSMHFGLAQDGNRFIALEEVDEATEPKGARTPAPVQKQINNRLMRRTRAVFSIKRVKQYVEWQGNQTPRPGRKLHFLDTAEVNIIPNNLEEHQNDQDEASFPWPTDGVQFPLEDLTDAYVDVPQDQLKLSTQGLGTSNGVEISENVVGIPSEQHEPVLSSLPSTPTRPSTRLAGRNPRFPKQNTPKQSLLALALMNACCHREQEERIKEDRERERLRQEAENRSDRQPQQHMWEDWTLFLQQQQSWGLNQMVANNWFPPFATMQQTVPTSLNDGPIGAPPIIFSLSTSEESSTQPAYYGQDSRDLQSTYFNSMPLLGGSSDQTSIYPTQPTFPSQYNPTMPSEQLIPMRFDDTAHAWQTLSEEEYEDIPMDLDPPVELQLDPQLMDHIYGLELGMPPVQAMPGTQQHADPVDQPPLTIFPEQDPIFTSLQHIHEASVPSYPTQLSLVQEQNHLSQTGRARLEATHRSLRGSGTNSLLSPPNRRPRWRPYWSFTPAQREKGKKILHRRLDRQRAQAQKSSVLKPLDEAGDHLATDPDLLADVDEAKTQNAVTPDVFRVLTQDSSPSETTEPPQMSVNTDLEPDKLEKSGPIVQISTPTLSDELAPTQSDAPTTNVVSQTTMAEPEPDLTPDPATSEEVQQELNADAPASSPCDVRVDKILETGDMVVQERSVVVEQEKPARRSKRKLQDSVAPVDTAPAKKASRTNTRRKAQEVVLDAAPSIEPAKEISVADVNTNNIGASRPTKPLRRTRKNAVADVPEAPPRRRIARSTAVKPAPKAELTAEPPEHSTGEVIAQDTLMPIGPVNMDGHQDVQTVTEGQEPTVMEGPTPVEKPQFVEERPIRSLRSSRAAKSAVQSVPEPVTNTRSTRRSKKAAEPVVEQQSRDENTAPKQLATPAIVIVEKTTAEEPARVTRKRRRVVEADEADAKAAEETKELVVKSGGRKMALRERKAIEVHSPKRQRTSNFVDAAEEQQPVQPAKRTRKARTVATVTATIDRELPPSPVKRTRSRVTRSGASQETAVSKVAAPLAVVKKSRALRK
ncbi:hypothetical protein DACRYDRAFT_108043 [Dacryopinax primogenitus]|uniref:FHA domain-containing protein n=1 Tax=Dacryopinax primogenitus (strain DJM 731) TaxID=1858805 RepID=M5GBU5_DACPD|nr:uncharacterized protein DACRYDRAFT_108043 [Dacryopinax primogenitus]EJU01493.1 hypothetical protein DACRYDRAFT_108043 [Dacryopinax primogenitus]